MVHPAILLQPFEGDHITRVGDDADEVCLARWVAAQLAQVALAEEKAPLAQAGALARLHEALGEATNLLLRAAHQI
jgi:hypothetical protein